MNPRRVWFAGVLLVAVACFGQSRDPDDSWWKQNYRFRFIGLFCIENYKH